MVTTSSNKGVEISSGLSNEGEANSSREQKLFQPLFGKGVS